VVRPARFLRAVFSFYAGKKMAGVAGRSGRKPTAVGEYLKQIRQSKDMMAGALVDVTDALLDAARGVYRLVIYEPATGEWRNPPSDAVLDNALQNAGSMVRIYREPPDLRAILAVHDRIMGKVAQPINVELREVIENAIADQELIASVLERVVPSEHLGAVITDIRRVREHRRKALAVLGGDDAATA
jgi:hypothetical protein